MKINPIQFQPGLSMPEFFERYGSEAQRQAALQAARWPSGFACPKCGGAPCARFVRGGSPYWQCDSCRHQTSLISGTMFEAGKLSPTRWFLAVQLLTQSKNNPSALELMHQLGMCYRSAWLLKHKIMEARRFREERRELGGRLEIDDAYLGGELSVGKAGRGSENKVPFAAAVQTTQSDHPLLACLRQQTHTTERLAVFAAQHISPSAKVVTDGLWCFHAAAIVGAEHERVVTGGGKASVKLPQFKAVNALLGNLKTAISSTYHAFAYAEHSHRCLAALQYRYNRRFDMRSILPRLLTALIAAPASPEHRLRLAAVHH